MSCFNTADHSHVHYVLLDIEGTISDINFVKNVLFPYSAKKLESFVKENLDDPIVKKATDDIGEPTIEMCIKRLLTWIQEDNKHPSLKTLQGMIWRAGFESNEFQSHLYEDVLPRLKYWNDNGIKMGIYSSGSIEAQKLFLKHTIYGDILFLFSNHFDLSTGPKKQMQSYQSISKQLNRELVSNPNIEPNIDSILETKQILFLSDVEAELDAAREANFLTGQIVREGTVASTRHKHFQTLYEV